MANIKSAKKRIKVIQVKTVRNRKIKSIVKTAIRRFEEAIAAGNFAEANDKFRYAEKKIFQAAAKGTFHKNAASRKVARLAKMLHNATNQAV
ncbi:small subunit ribosomal protein S20 [Geosporobacter subterraneus DSM 17957]|uniref:Small ribosomal subunit protein bS20 n=1 Tax=Geosporobacter subterraneus DSM 17957 TaxID=1121919 RepID=A0A1M6JGY1_9FIRM|nr:30S ribosomal protein S20 [Geosporobacter subterraneus]SHJ45927.1 small subunit ribosomal protein S20 [Geosporobacter subterraneus DSM 17957]